MLDDVSLQAHSIVVLGRFNPSIFSPAWMRLHNLLGEKEVEDSRIAFIVPPAANFSTDWLSVNVTEQHLTLSSAIPQDYVRLRETAVGILSVLKETPVNAIGFNLECHWLPSSPDAAHAFADALVPKDYWEERGLLLAGIQDLTIRGVRKDLWAGSKNVSLQPSNAVTGALFARVNDHYDLRRVERQPASRADFLSEEFLPVPVEPSSANIEHTLTILRDNWDDSLADSESTIGSMIYSTRP